MCVRMSVCVCVCMVRGLYCSRREGHSRIVRVWTVENSNGTNEYTNHSLYDPYLYFLVTSLTLKRLICEMEWDNR